MVCAVTVLLSWVFIFGAYFALPIGRESGLRALVRLGTDIALVGAVVFWQLRRISQALLPELRSIEGLGVIVAVFLVAFSSTYLAMSHQAATTFTMSLDHVRALYFTISVFSTVGFGDITPRTDAARLVVSAQMLLDLVVIGAVVRIIFNAARNRVGAPSPPRVSRRRDPDSAPVGIGRLGGKRRRLREIEFLAKGVVQGLGRGRLCLQLGEP